MLSYRERYQREFPTKYSELKADNIISWEAEYDKCVTDNYSGLKDHHIELIRSIKLDAVDAIEAQVSKFLSADAKDGQVVILPFFLMSGDVARFTPIHLREWLKKYRADIADIVCDTVYNKIIIPYCASDPNQLLVWAVKMERPIDELRACLQKANDNKEIAQALNIACESGNRDRATIILEYGDINSLFDKATVEAGRHILDHITKDDLQSFINSRSQAGNASSINLVNRLRVPFNDSNWRSLCSCNPCTEKHLEIVDIYLRSGSKIPDDLLTSGQVATKEMQIYLMLKSNQYHHGDLDKYYLEACTLGNKALVSHLLKAGADVNCLDEHGQNGFTLAMRNGHDDLLRMLVLVHKANIKSVYLQACAENNLDIISKLKSIGCIVHVGDHPLDVNAIKMACKNGHAAIVKILLSHGYGTSGVKDSTLLQSVLAPFDQLGLNTFFDVIKNPPDRALPIDVVLSKADEKVIANLLDTLWNRTDDNEGNITHYLYFAKACHYGRASDIARIISAEKGDPTDLLGRSTHYSPNAAVINYLLDCGANPKQHPKIITCACRTGDLALIERIISAGVELQGSELKQACLDGNIDLVKFLLDKKMPINHRDESSGLTILDLAIMSNHSEVAQLLLDHGADVSRHPTKGVHPLGILFNKMFVQDELIDNSFPLVTKLLTRGADPTKILEYVANEMQDDPVKKGSVFLMIMECTIAQIQDLILREQVLSNFQSYFKKIEDEQVKPEKDLVKCYQSLKSLVDMVNHKDSHTDLVRLRDKRDTPDIVKESFKIDKITYDNSLSRTAVTLHAETTPHANMLNQYLSAAVHKLVNVYDSAHQSNKVFHMFANSKHADDCQSLLSEFNAIDKSSQTSAEQTAAKLLFLQTKFCEAVIGLMERKKIAKNEFTDEDIIKVYELINENPKDHHYIRMLALALDCTEKLMNLTSANQWLRQPVMSGLAKHNKDYQKVYNLSYNIDFSQHKDAVTFSGSKAKKDQTVSYKPLNDVYKATRASITVQNGNEQNSNSNIQLSRR